MQRYLTVFIFQLISLGAFAQLSPEGVWKTIDDETGEAKSYVEIYQTGNEYHGKVVELLLNDDDLICDLCSGKRKNKPVLGMNVIEGLKKHKDYWKDGVIVDPKNGNEYGCSVWYESNDPSILKVRGKHWTGLFRTQTWYRVE